MPVVTNRIRNIVRKPAKSLTLTKYITPIVAAAMAMKSQNVTIARPTLSARQPPHQRPEERDRHLDLRERRLYQQREGGRVADERAEGPDIDVGHHPGVLALDDDELVAKARLCRGEIVHEEIRADYRNR